MVSQWITVQAHQGRSDNPRRTAHPFLVQVVYDPQGDISIRQKGCWAGIVDSSSGKVRFAVVDANGNGVYGDRMILEPDDRRKCEPGDALFIDADGSGKIDLSASPNGVRLLTDVVGVGDALYTFALNDVGDMVTITAYAGPTGTLLIQPRDISGMTVSVDRGEVYGYKGDYDIKELLSHAVTLPTDHYTFGCLLTLRQGSDQLALWCDSYSDIDVRAGEFQQIDLSGEITSAINPADKKLVLHTGRDRVINWSVMIGDRLKAAWIRDDSSAHGPRIDFFDAKGEPVYSTHASYSFHTEGFENCRFHVKDIKPGTYSMRISLDTKSRLGILSAERGVHIVH